MAKLYRYWCNSSSVRSKCAKTSCCPAATRKSATRSLKPTTRGAVIPTLAGEGLVVETPGGATLTVAEVSEVVLKVLGAMIAVVETLIEALEEGTIMPTLAGGGVALEMQLGAMVPLAEVFEVAEMAKKVLGAMLVAVEIIEALEEAMVL